MQFLFRAQHFHAHDNLAGGGIVKCNPPSLAGIFHSVQVSPLLCSTPEVERSSLRSMALYLLASGTGIVLKSCIHSKQRDLEINVFVI